MSKQTYIYSESGALRVDEALLLFVEKSTKSHWKKECDKGRIFVNGLQVKAKTLVKQGDTIEVRQQVFSDELTIDVVYKDDYILAICKPIGLLTMAKNIYDNEPTVASLCKEHVDDSVERNGIVHRLDRDTSGILLVARTQSAFEHLQKQFKERSINKQYAALVEGILSQDRFLIDMPIGRDSRRPYSFKTTPNGKDAQTEVLLQKQNDTTALVELKPITGRTHQLRVHLKAINHPIIGDALYNPQKNMPERLMLHAASITFTNMDGKMTTCSAQIPESMANYTI